jgi:hypothetical protein
MSQVYLRHGSLSDVRAGHCTVGFGGRSARTQDRFIEAHVGARRGSLRGASSVRVPDRAAWLAACVPSCQIALHAALQSTRLPTTLPYLCALLTIQRVVENADSYGLAVMLPSSRVQLRLSSGNPRMCVLDSGLVSL